MKLRQRARRVLSDPPVTVIQTVPELIGTAAAATRGDRDDHVMAARVEVETRSLRAEANRLADLLVMERARTADAVAAADELRDQWRALLEDHAPRSTGRRSGRQVCQTCIAGYDAESGRMVKSPYPCPPARAALKALGRSEMGVL